ncbi:MAG TPA: TRAP transporter TatT component family protein [Pyrinomonadaceae bacterium]|jgi:tetratricopeptide (TPR) repeat protein|nr:TRAP transporter TatT component family protein [Pyrinomonadaceae bacterium]
MEQTLSEIIRRADALYMERERIENIRASVELLESAAAMAADDFETMWRSGRAHFFLGQEAETKTAAREFHARGASVCERATRRAPARVEGHFWLGVNLALQAQTVNALTAIRLAWRARRSLERAVRIDPAYHDAGPLRVLARLKHKLPRLLGGGRARARADFIRAIELAPSNTVTRLYFAELLLETGDVASAESELKTILESTLHPDWKFETARDRRLAQEVLERIGSSQ